MASNEKLFNKEIIKQIFRKVGWLGAIYQLLLLLVVTWPIFRQCLDYKSGKGFNEESIYESIFWVSPDLQVLIVIFIPIILGMFLFNFLMKEKAAVFTHSLPLSRKSIFLHHTLSGIVILILPVIITMFVTWIVVSTASLPVEYEYFKWILSTISISLAMFSLTTIVAMITGNFIIQGALTLGFLALPLIVYEGLTSTISTLFIGFDFQPTFLDKAWREYSAETMLLLISLFIITLSYFVYLKRDIENSSKSIVFKRLRPIFKYGLTFVGMLSISILVDNSIQTMIQFFISLVVGSLIGYFAAVLILRESKLSFRKFFGFLVYSGVFTVIFVGLHLSSSAYESNIPSVSEVSSVAIYNSSYYNAATNEDFIETFTLNEEESIETVVEIHQFIAEEAPHTYGYNNLTITYNLEDGDQLSRSYNTSFLKDGMKSVVEPLINIPEMIDNYCAYLDDSVRNNADSIVLYTYTETYEITNDDKDLFNSFLDALIADIAAVGLHDQIYDDETGVTTVSGHEAYITYDIVSEENGYINYSYISKDYVNTVKWFEENGYEDVANFLKSDNTTV